MIEDFREKYRPKRFSEVIGNKSVLTTLRNMVQRNRIPSGILFLGPPGSGKTTLAFLLIKALLCENFSGDVCGQCKDCQSFERFRSAPSEYWYHDCATISGRSVDEIVDNLKALAMTKLHRRIHIFDEFHRAKENIQEKFLTPLERIEDILLIFCLIDLKNINEAFRQRVTILRTSRPEIGDLVPWLQGICTAEGINVMNNNALEQVAESAGRLPRACLSLLEKASLQGGPLTISLVKELALDTQESSNHGPRSTLMD